MLTAAVSTVTSVCAHEMSTPVGRGGESNYIVEANLHMYSIGDRMH